MTGMARIQNPLLFASLLFGLTGFAAATPAVPQTVQDVVEVVLKRPEGGAGQPIFLRGSATVDPQTCGQTSNLKLRIRNASDRALEFDAARVTCNCARLNLPATSVAPGQAVDAELDWTIPWSHEQDHTSLGISLKHGHQDVATLSLMTGLLGNLHVGGTSFGRRSAEGLVEWRVPFHCTTPVKPGELVVGLGKEIPGMQVALDLESPDETPDLPDFVRAFREKTGFCRHWIVLTAHEDLVGREFLFGTVVLVHPPTGARCEKNLLLEARSAVTVTPAVLRFRPVDDRPGHLQAMALVNVDASALRSEAMSDGPQGEPAGARTEPPYSVHCLLNGEPVESAVRLLGKNVSRVELILDAKRLSDPAARFVWEIATAERRWRIESGYIRSDQ